MDCCFFRICSLTLLLSSVINAPPLFKPGIYKVAVEDNIPDEEEIKQIKHDIYKPNGPRF